MSLADAIMSIGEKNGVDSQLARQIAEKALVKILWQQDDSSHLGEMPVDTAVEQLAERGFTDGTEYLGTEDIVYAFFAYWNHEDRHTYGIVPEFMKTEEYKREAERQSERVLEKMKEWQEIDAADRNRAERKARARDNREQSSFSPRYRLQLCCSIMHSIHDFS